MIERWLGRADRWAIRRPVGPPPLSLRLAAVLAVPLLLYALLATGQKAYENYQLNQQADSLRADVRNLRAENVRLQQEIVQARSDASIESIAREELGLAKPGDHAVVLVPDTASVPAQTAPVPAAVVSPPPWRQWWDVFFGSGT